MRDEAARLQVFQPSVDLLGLPVLKLQKIIDGSVDYSTAVAMD